MIRTTSPASIVSLRGITRRFREGDRVREVLRGADLEIRRGERVALLGPSGSGKSTLLNLMSGIDRPDEGSIRVDGVELTALAERDRTLFRRDRIGFVFQFFNLIPTLTVEENVLFPLELQGRATGEGREEALEVLAAVGLGDRRRSFPDLLSGGEQQRVAIARAVAHDPVLLLADEPTGNLDRESGDRVMTLLDRLVRERGRTLVLVTHATPLLAWADRAFTLDAGRIRPADAAAGAPPR